MFIGVLEAEQARKIRLRFIGPDKAAQPPLWFQDRHGS
jgi:hypothetical protein